MKKVILSFVAAAIALACGERVSDVEVIPVQDNANPRLMPRALFSEAPDDLFERLGLQDGIPSSVCAFLVKTEGKNILFDAANGAPDSRLMGVLDSCSTFSRHASLHHTLKNPINHTNMRKTPKRFNNH